ncbi:MAG: leucyl aminopeptidase [Alphaproteobacteria bacterium 64-11]|nr:leucyl aminopeptidase [Alphaproteobacteria bacterium]OJU14176.1 MAG: leucyl aminopeptidase [Alphaproteobacteria bacterium 64-11]
MQISFTAPTRSAGDVTQGAWVVSAAEGTALLPAAVRADRASGGALTRALKVSSFKGKAGEFLEVLAPAGLKVSRILLVGLGKADGLDEMGLETLGGKIVARLQTAGESVATWELEVPNGAPVKPAQLATHLALGARLAGYVFDKYRTRDLDDYRKSLKTVRVAAPDPAVAKKAFAGLSALADGVFLARDLVNEPPNVLHPAEFARRARTALSKVGVKVEVLGEAEMKRQGFGALLGVGQGSARESQLVVMQWNGAPKAKKANPVAFVGKGVCFDSGGLSIKVGAGMQGMKGDMAGAAAVTGTMLALAARKAKVNAVGVIGLVENMPGGDAIRPDDVLTSLSGQTIEVLNTDAEGRLVLADALTYTQRRFSPRAVIDLATLTGAIIQTLGFEHAGLFSNDDKLADRLAEAGRHTGERVWRLPLDPFYDKMLKSKIADMKNIGGPNSGAITAAQFLKRFIEKDTHWAHLDIAGVAWQDGERRPTIPSWATGWGVRILDRLVGEHYET